LFWIVVSRVNVHVGCELKQDGHVRSHLQWNKGIAGGADGFDQVGDDWIIVLQDGPIVSGHREKNAAHIAEPRPGGQGFGDAGESERKVLVVLQRNHTADGQGRQRSSSTGIIGRGRIGPSGSGTGIKDVSKALRAVQRLRELSGLDHAGCADSLSVDRTYVGLPGRRERTLHSVSELYDGVALGIGARDKDAIRGAGREQVRYFMPAEIVDPDFKRGL